MIKIEKNAFLSPLGTFFIYILASGAAIMGFRLVFPGEAAPLACFSFSWRLIRGFLDFIDLFPALTLSALVIPFGFRIQAGEKNSRFSPQFFKSLKMPIITTIVAAALFGLLFSLALPLARDYETNLRFLGRLYRLARERAEEHAAREEWAETGQFLAVCERIWPAGPEVAKLKTEADIRLEQESMAPLDAVEPEAGPSPQTGLPGPQPLDATEALALAQTALTEERYFDAHWLATLGGRLAKSGSVESAAAARLGGLAWSRLNSMAPNARETREYNIFALKREGYEALLAEKWVQAYYTFQNLLAVSPEDPDAEKYLALSGEGLKQEAFFIDEIELALGKVLTGAVFSLPQGAGRLVMRISSLSTSPDSAYGMGIEILSFDRDGRPLWSMKAPYAKILPLTLNSGGGGEAPGVTVLMRALHREDRAKFWEPEIRGLGEAPPAAQIALNVSWDNFLLLSNIHRGVSGLSPAALLSAAENLENYGCQPEVFEAELLRRFANPLFLLPSGIFAIVIGWQYRARKRPRYMGIPMLGILPLVFDGATYFFHGLISKLGILAVVSLGFTSAAAFFGIGILALLVFSLIVLAAQNG